MYEHSDGSPCSEQLGKFIRAQPSPEMTESTSGDFKFYSSGLGFIAQYRIERRSTSTTKLVGIMIALSQPPRPRTSSHEPLALDFRFPSPFLEIEYKTCLAKG